MTQDNAPKVGSIVWTDLTVSNAEQIRDFYTAVVGWQPEPVDMGAHSDFTMKAVDGQGVTGICHARGTNAELPRQWLMYIIVEDLDQSAARLP